MKRRLLLLFYLLWYMSRDLIYHIKKENVYTFPHSIDESLSVNITWEDFLAKIYYDPVNAGVSRDLIYYIDM